MDLTGSRQGKVSCLIQRRAQRLLQPGAIVRALHHLRSVAGGVKVDGISGHHQLEEVSLFCIAGALHADAHPSRVTGIARAMVNLAVIDAKVGEQRGQEAVHHQLELRRVATKRRRGEKDDCVALHDRLRDLSARVAEAAQPRRFEPAGKAADAMRQLELVQGKGAHLRPRLLEQVAQDRIGRRQVLFAGLPAIQQSNLPTDHSRSPFPSCFGVVSAPLRALV